MHGAGSKFKCELQASRTGRTMGNTVHKQKVKIRATKCLEYGGGSGAPSHRVPSSATRFNDHANAKRPPRYDSP